jgi:hypothetical protein
VGPSTYHQSVCASVCVWGGGGVHSVPCALQSADDNTAVLVSLWLVSLCCAKQVSLVVATAEGLLYEFVVEDLHSSTGPKCSLGGEWTLLGTTGLTAAAT